MRSRNDYSSSAKRLQRRGDASTITTGPHKPLHIDLDRLSTDGHCRSNQFTRLRPAFHNLAATVGANSSSDEPLPPATPRMPSQMLSPEVTSTTPTMTINLTNGPKT